MSVLTDFNDFKQRVVDFSSDSCDEHFRQFPILRGLARMLILLEWEGTPEILNDVFVAEKDETASFIATLERLNYRCVSKNYSSLYDIPQDVVPSLIQIENLNAILLGIQDEELLLYDYANNNTIEYRACDLPCQLIWVSEYSQLFREAPPQSQDRSNWIKYVFYRYNDEFKSLVLLSFMISVLGALQPFFIMSVYNFALSSGSIETLLWLTVLALIIGIFEYSFKKMRVHIITTSGKDLAVYISQNVLSKLLWLPYAMTSKAGVSSQLARLKDIDTFRRLVTAESTLSYFDMPFIIVFIIAIAILSGSAALVVLGGIVLMVLFCLYSRYIYTQATAKSTRANAMVSYQWNEALRSIETIQGLPLLKVIQSRFTTSHQQSTQDAENVSLTNSKVQNAGGALIQIIGTASIVMAVLGVMDGTSDAGAMLATVILVWKALGPIMGIYNSIAKFQSIKASAAQINNLMSFNDDKSTLEKSPPIRQLHGQITGSGITHRYFGLSTGLTNLGFKIAQGEKVAICGGSGCGKTTLIAILAGLEANYQGALLIDGYNIKQFNNYRFRHSITYIPLNLYLFEGTLESNFVIHNGVMSRREMELLLNYFDLLKWLPDGLETHLSQERFLMFPNGVQQKLRLAIGLGGMHKNLVIIDEPFTGVEKEFADVFHRLCMDYLIEKTVIFTTNDTSIVAASTSSLVLEQDGNLKYFGSTDKYLGSLSR